MIRGHKGSRVAPQSPEALELQNIVRRQQELIADHEARIQRRHEENKRQRENLKKAHKALMKDFYDQARGLWAASHDQKPAPPVNPYSTSFFEKKFNDQTSKYRQPPPQHQRQGGDEGPLLPGAVNQPYVPFPYSPYDQAYPPDYGAGLHQDFHVVPPYPFKQADHSHRDASAHDPLRDDLQFPYRPVNGDVPQRPSRSYPGSMRSEGPYQQVHPPPPPQQQQPYPTHAQYTSEGHLNPYEHEPRRRSSRDSRGSRGDDPRESHHPPTIVIHPPQPKHELSAENLSMHASQYQYPPPHNHMSDPRTGFPVSQPHRSQFENPGSLRHAYSAESLSSLHSAPKPYADDVFQNAPPAFDRVHRAPNQTPAAHSNIHHPQHQSHLDAQPVFHSTLRPPSGKPHHNNHNLLMASTDSRRSHRSNISNADSVLQEKVLHVQNELAAQMERVADLVEFEAQKAKELEMKAEMLESLTADLDLSHTHMREVGDDETFLPDTHSEAGRRSFDHPLLADTQDPQSLHVMDMVEDEKKQQHGFGNAPPLLSSRKTPLPDLRVQKNTMANGTPPLVDSNIEVDLEWDFPPPAVVSDPAVPDGRLAEEARKQAALTVQMAKMQAEVEEYKRQVLEAQASREALFQREMFEKDRAMETEKELLKSKIQQEFAALVDQQNKATAAQFAKMQEAYQKALRDREEAFLAEKEHIRVQIEREREKERNASLMAIPVSRPHPSESTIAPPQVLPRSSPTMAPRLSKIPSVQASDNESDEEQDLHLLPPTSLTEELPPALPPRPQPLLSASLNQQATLVPALPPAPTRDLPPTPSQDPNEPTQNPDATLGDAPMVQLRPKKKDPLSTLESVSNGISRPQSTVFSSPPTSPRFSRSFAEDLESSDDKPPAGDDSTALSAPKLNESTVSNASTTSKKRRSLLGLFGSRSSKKDKGKKKKNEGQDRSFTEPGPVIKATKRQQPAAKTHDSPDTISPSTEIEEVTVKRHDGTFGLQLVQSEGEHFLQAYSPHGETASRLDTPGVTLKPGIYVTNLERAVVTRGHLREWDRVIKANGVDFSEKRVGEIILLLKSKPKLLNLVVEHLPSRLIKEMDRHSESANVAANSVNVENVVDVTVARFPENGSLNVRITPHHGGVRYEIHALENVRYHGKQQLHPGDELVYINGLDCRGMAFHVVGQILSDKRHSKFTFGVIHHANNAFPLPAPSIPADHDLSDTPHVLSQGSGLEVHHSNGSAGLKEKLASSLPPGLRSDSALRDASSHVDESDTHPLQRGERVKDNIHLVTVVRRNKMLNARVIPIEGVKGGFTVHAANDQILYEGKEFFQDGDVLVLVDGAEVSVLSFSKLTKLLKDDSKDKVVFGVRRNPPPELPSQDTSHLSSPPPLSSQQPEKLDSCEPVPSLPPREKSIPELNEKRPPEQLKNGAGMTSGPSAIPDLIPRPALVRNHGKGTETSLTVSSLSPDESDEDTFDEEDEPPPSRMVPVAAPRPSAPRLVQVQVSSSSSLIHQTASPSLSQPHPDPEQPRSTPPAEPQVPTMDYTLSTFQKGPSQSSKKSGDPVSRKEHTGNLVELRKVHSKPSNTTTTSGTNAKGRPPSSLIITSNMLAKGEAFGNMMDDVEEISSISSLSDLSDIEESEAGSISKSVPKAENTVSNPRETMVLDDFLDDEGSSAHIPPVSKKRGSTPHLPESSINTMQHPSKEGAKKTGGDLAEAELDSSDEEIIPKPSEIKPVISSETPLSSPSMPPRNLPTTSSSSSSLRLGAPPPLLTVVKSPSTANIAPLEGSIKHEKPDDKSKRIDGVIATEGGHSPSHPLGADVHELTALSDSQYFLIVKTLVGALLTSEMIPRNISLENAFVHIHTTSCEQILTAILNNKFLMMHESLQLLSTLFHVFETIAHPDWLPPLFVATQLGEAPDRRESTLLQYYDERHKEMWTLLLDYIELVVLNRALHALPDVSAKLHSLRRLSRGSASDLNASNTEHQQGKDLPDNAHPHLSNSVPEDGLPASAPRVKKSPPKMLDEFTYDFDANTTTGTGPRTSDGTGDGVSSSERPALRLASVSSRPLSLISQASMNSTFLKRDKGDDPYTENSIGAICYDLAVILAPLLFQLTPQIADEGKVTETQARQRDYDSRKRTASRFKTFLQRVRDPLGTITDHSEDEEGEHGVAANGSEKGDTTEVIMLKPASKPTRVTVGPPATNDEVGSQESPLHASVSSPTDIDPPNSGGKYKRERIPSEGGALPVFSRRGSASSLMIPSSTFNTPTDELVYLLTRNKRLVRACLLADPFNTNMADAFLTLFTKAKKLPLLIDVCVECEIAITVQGNALLGPNTLMTRALVLMCRLSAATYLPAILKDSYDRVVKDPSLFLLSKARGSATRKSERALASIVQALLTRLCQSASEVPALVKHVLSTLHREVAVAFPQREREVLLDLFFFRLVFPALSTPQDFLGVGRPSVVQAEALNEVVRVLNAVVRGRPFNHVAQPAFVVFNTLIAANRPHIFHFLDEISVPPMDSQTQLEGTLERMCDRITPEDHTQALSAVTTFLLEREAPISSALTTRTECPYAPQDIVPHAMVTFLHSCFVSRALQLRNLRTAATWPPSSSSSFQPLDSSSFSVLSQASNNPQTSKVEIVKVKRSFMDKLKGTKKPSFKIVNNT